jgi:hypothetical protein
MVSQMLSGFTVECQNREFQRVGSMTTTAPATIARPMPEPDFYSEAALIIMQKHDPKSIKSYQELLKAGLFADACRWVAVQLPVRHSVWWGLICVMDTKDGHLNRTLVNQLTQWVIEPTSAKQTQIMNESWLDTPGSALEYIAKAVSWTGPSMLPIHLPVTAPNPEHVRRMIAAGIDLAATGHGKLEPADAYRRFLDFATDVDNGKLHWENTEASTPKAQQTSRPQGLFPHQ